LGHGCDAESKMACVHRNSVKMYVKTVNTDGLDGVTVLHYKDAKSALLGHKSSIETAFRKKSRVVVRKRLLVLKQ
jgi:hypothetical protein